MTVPRKQLINLQSTPYYHVINRCVRRAFLCGQDPYSGHCYEHRRRWILEKVRKLSSVFAIDVCAYAIMSNHYHLVLHVNKKEASQWSLRDVVSRWCQIYSGPQLIQDYLALKPQSASELYVINELANRWRERLHDISWFMRSLNESIARQANAEDRCTGRFWQGRFRSQALLDEGALLTCMMYVDLNPIRAGMAQSLEKSDFTSIQERIYKVAKSFKQARRLLADKHYPFRSNSTCESKSLKSQRQKSREKHKSAEFNKPLLGFIGSEHIKREIGIPCNFGDYLDLIDWTGRSVRYNKKGAIPRNVKTLFQRLSINDEAWIEAVTQFERQFGIAIGAEVALTRYGHNLTSRWLRGKRSLQKLYIQAPSQTF